MDANDESFEYWVRRREQERQRKRGRLRVNTLKEGAQRGSHVDPEAPRLISRWDGYCWEPVAVASDLAEAAAMLQSDCGDGERSEQLEPRCGSGTAQDGDLRGMTIAERKRARVRQMLDEEQYRPGSPR
ncbi:DUF6087 family protein [Actinacidiphila guanduensis]|uniref:DUF6087 family protein n=1 Tax=Actinacidiphila guanduensis TaxID=310781 RepID=UPI0011600353|nr:DUF6087 family protein [Actinacidiphila guanduensis]